LVARDASAALAELDATIQSGTEIGLLLDQLVGYFRDVMVSGPFRYFEHDHHFAAMDDGTRIRDEIRFSASWGPLGRILARRRPAALIERSAVIKRVAESNEWRQYLESDMEDGPVAAPIKSDSEVGRKNSIRRTSRQIVVPRPPHA
jgi:hypothetical protein